MSYDNIPPIEIQIEIITRLPPKSVFRFACVSKQWNSLIHSSKFFIDYTHNSLIHTQQQQQRLFIVEKRNKRTSVERYRSFVDDDAFPQNKSIPFLPEPVSRLILSKVAGSSHGLLCLLGFFKKRLTDTAVIWNPLINKSVCIALTKDLSHRSSIGFGVCPKTCDPKIVRIDPTEEDTGCTNWQVEVFRLSSGTWRRIPSGNLPAKWLEFPCNDPVVVDGFIYWVVTEGRIETLVSFDLTSEKFKQIYLPEKLLACGKRIQIFKFRESLAIFARKRTLVYKVWTTENGAFKKLLTIDGFHLLASKPPVFRRNGQLILTDTNHRLLLYKPDSNEINELGIYGDHRSSYVSFNTESILLLDQSDTLTVRGCK